MLLERNFQQLLYCNTTLLLLFHLKSQTTKKFTRSATLDDTLSNLTFTNITFNHFWQLNHHAFNHEIYKMKCLVINKGLSSIS